MCSKHCCVVCSCYSVILLLLIVVLLFVVAPVTFMLSFGIQKSLVLFPTYFIEPKNYSNPESHGITGVRNMYVDILYPNSENVTIGLWQILPQEIVNDIVRNDEYNFEGILANENYYILLYLHGNGGDRSESIALYKILRRFFHIFAIDYRGYADSTLTPNMTETSIVNDVVHIFKWLKERSKAKIFIWGHSLGSAVATHVAANLQKDNISAMGVVLEAPFTSVVDVMKMHPLYKYFSCLPWWRQTLLDPIESNDLNFDSASYIRKVDCPVMILHAKDDDVIPYEVATELYYIAVNHRNQTYQGDVTFHLYDAYGYGHMQLYLEKKLPGDVKQFINECVKFFDKKSA